MTGITAENINKSYAGENVLRNFSVSFAWGSCTAIMGPSGCGKTTLLNILMGLDLDFTGEVNGMPACFGVVFQEDRLCEEFSVLANLLMVTDKSLQGNSCSVEEILEALGISELAEKKVKELSGGQKRRVAIARALLYDAQLLIMDEPFNGLDGETRIAAARAVLGRRRTVIFVTHDPYDVELMGADVVKMTKTFENISDL